MGLHDRDYMKKGSPDDATEAYEKGVHDREYGDYSTRRKSHMGRLTVKVLILVPLIAVIGALIWVLVKGE